MEDKESFLRKIKDSVVVLDCGHELAMSGRIIRGRRRTYPDRYQSYIIMEKGTEKIDCWKCRHEQEKREGVKK